MTAPTIQVMRRPDHDDYLLVCGPLAITVTSRELAHPLAALTLPGAIANRFRRQAAEFPKPRPVTPRPAEIRAWLNTLGQ